MVDFVEEVEKNPELKQEDIDNIKQWMVKQPHLPRISDDHIIVFLHSCFYKLEATKNTIENYFTIRTNATELFANRDPLSKEIQEALETMHIVKLPIKTPEGYDVFFSKMNRTDTQYFSSVDIMKAYHMHGDICYNKGARISPGVVYVIDMDGCSLSHLFKINLTALKNHFQYLQEALPVRLKAIHLLNSASIITVLMNMIKPFVKAELLNMIYSYTSGSEDVYKLLPKNILPREYGGESPSIYELHAETKKQLEEHREWFKKEELQRADPSKRTGKSKTDSDSLDFVGSFKKISFD